MSDRTDQVAPTDLAKRATDPQDRPDRVTDPQDRWDELLRQAKTAPAQPGRRASWPVGQAKRGREYPFESAPMRARLLDHLRKGYPPSTVALACGVSPAVWRQWERRGDAGEQPFARWFAEARQARVDGQIGLLDLVRAAGEGTKDQHGVWKNQWQAARWLLERADPTYLEAPAAQVEVQVEARHTVDVSALSTDELEDLYRLTAKVESGALPEGGGGAALSEGTGPQGQLSEGTVIDAEPVQDDRSDL
jgi:hypothetical protein